MYGSVQNCKYDAFGHKHFNLLINKRVTTYFEYVNPEHSFICSSNCNIESGLDIVWRGSEPLRTNTTYRGTNNGGKNRENSSISQTRVGIPLGYLKSDLPRESQMLASEGTPVARRDGGLGRRMPAGTYFDNGY